MANHPWPANVLRCASGLRLSQAHDAVFQASRQALLTMQACYLSQLSQHTCALFAWRTGCWRARTQHFQLQTTCHARAHLTLRLLLKLVALCRCWQSGAWDAACRGRPGAGVCTPAAAPGLSAVLPAGGAASRHVQHCLQEHTSWVLI